LSLCWEYFFPLLLRLLALIIGGIIIIVIGVNTTPIAAFILIAIGVPIRSVIDTSVIVETILTVIPGPEDIEMINTNKP